MRHKLTNPEQFILAGNATFTMVDTRTDTRYTYRVRKGKQETAPHFVSVMYGPNNETDYRYMGAIFNRAEYRTTKNSKINAGDPRNKYFQATWIKRIQLPKFIEIWHEGTCGKCGRKLTVPESIESGLGPWCSGQIKKGGKK